MRYAIFLLGMVSIFTISLQSPPLSPTVLTILAEGVYRSEYLFACPGISLLDASLRTSGEGKRERPFAILKSAVDILVLASFSEGDLNGLYRHHPIETPGV